MNRGPLSIGGPLSACTVADDYLAVVPGGRRLRCAHRDRLRRRRPRYQNGDGEVLPHDVGRVRRGRTPDDRRASSALQHLKRSGVRLGGVPYGFRTETPGGPLLPNEAEMAVVREILRLRGPGDMLTSYRAIAHHLTASGVPTRHGGAWKAETVRRIAGRHAPCPDGSN